MNFKPLRDYSEHDVVNLFKLNTATGAKCTPVVINNASGWNNSLSSPTIFSNLAAGYDNGNITSPRWQIRAEVRAAVSGEKPFGVTLFDTLEVNQWGYPYLYDVQRKIEKQVCLSGEAVPIVRKGMFLIGPFVGGGDLPGPGKYVAVKGTGDMGVVTAVSGQVPTGAFGEFLGTRDNDGYALVHINCWK